MAKTPEAAYRDPKPQYKIDKRGAASARRILESGEVINMAELAGRSLGIFGGTITLERTPVVELNAALPLSDLRDERETTGSATISDAEQGAYRSTSTAARGT